MDYTVHAAGRATGISPWRIRTWERRYGVPAPRRDAGGRRTYSEADLAVLRRMAALVDKGMRASHAADAVRIEADLAVGSMPSRPPIDARVAPLLAAASAFNERECVDMIASAASLGWDNAVNAVVMPALLELGAQWERGETSLAVEHFLSQLIHRELLAAIAAIPAPLPSASLVLVAGVQDDFHDLGAIALWLLLRQRGIGVVCLGADVPSAALAAAVATIRPRVVCLTGVATTSTPMLAEAARTLIEAKTDAQVFVGGPATNGTAAERIPAPRLPESLLAAVQVLVAAATG